MSDPDLVTPDLVTPRFTKSGWPLNRGQILVTKTLSPEDVTKSGSDCIRLAVGLTQSVTDSAPGATCKQPEMVPVTPQPFNLVYPNEHDMWAIAILLYLASTSALYPAGRNSYFVTLILPHPPRFSMVSRIGSFRKVQLAAGHAIRCTDSKHDSDFEYNFENFHNRPRISGGRCRN
eukprot:sb/3471898/